MHLSNKHVPIDIIIPLFSSLGVRFVNDTCAQLHTSSDDEQKT